jgi:hypothetical protein
VPKLLHGTSKAQAEAIYQLLVEWGLKDHVKAMCFDTTATNTGKKIEYHYFYFLCRYLILLNIYIL